MNLKENIRRILKEVRVPRSERVELYKDDNIIVVVPLTHRALQKYAHRCQWCINDDIGEWEDYHKGKHAVIIQRNPKKPKIGITGNPVASELFLLDKLEQNQYDLESIKNILGYQFKDRNEMVEYFQTIGNDISDFATNIVYYSPINGLFDQEDNYMWSYNMEISQIPNVTLEVIKIIDDYLSRSKNVDLQENIRRILREESEIPINVRRRFDILKKLVDVILSNSYPCDFVNEDHYFEGVLYDLETFLITFEMEGMTKEEILSFIRDYFYDNIKRYYIDSQEDC